MKFVRRLPLALLLLGGLLRVAIWWQDRSLFIDEANLARNVCELGLADFFRPLHYDQFAPPLFLLLEKCAAQALGCTSLALRLLPLLAGLLALLLFWRILQRLVPQAEVRWWPVAIFSFSTFYAQYATELKQYSTDACAALALVWLALRLPPDTRKGQLIWAAVGAAAIWFSMPAVFVLAGVGAFFLLKNPNSVPKTWLLAAAWLASFAAYFCLILQKSIANPMLQEHHAEHFFPLLPQSLADWQRAGKLLLAFPYNSAGFTVFALALGMVGMLGGLFWAFRARKTEVLLLAAPIAACLAASGLGQYSLMPRLLAWAFPLTMILMAVGIGHFFEKTPPKLRALWLVAMLASASLHTGWRFFAEKFEVNAIREVLAEVAKNSQPDDLWVIDDEAAPAFLFYRDCDARRPLGDFRNPVLFAAWDFRPENQSFMQNGRLPRRAWLIYSTLISEKQKQAARAEAEAVGHLARQEMCIEKPGAAAWLFVW